MQPASTNGSGSACWRLRLAGRPALLSPDGTELALEGVAALIAARLALAGPQSREWLAHQLWPAADESRARGNLRQRLLRLKVQAGRTWIDGGDRLQLQADVHLDPLGAAPLLEGVMPPEGDEFADWLAQAREGRLQQRRESLLAGLQQAEANQQLDEAVALAAQWVALEPVAEAPRRNLARLHYLNNDHGRALAVLDDLARMLQRDHAAGPSPASEQLRRLVQRSAEAGLIPPPSPTSPALLRPPRLVGRGKELALLRRTLDEGGALLLLGEAGMGKSRLLAEALAQSPAALAVKAQAGDAGVPYATLARLLRRLLARQGGAAPPGPGDPLLSRLLPELRGNAGTLPLPPEGARLLLQESVQSLLARAGLQALAVDDLHFADEASLELLQSLIGGEAGAPIAWLLAQRPGEGTPAARALQDGLVESGRLQPLALAALDAPQVAELVRSLDLAGLDADDLAPRLHRHTGGNPLFLLETLKQMRATDGAGARLPGSATVDALIDRRLRALDEGALALARLAAIAGPDFSAALAEQVSGRPALALADAWAALEAAQVLRDRSFAHDLVLEATLRGIPRPIAEHLHAAVAKVLQTTGAEPARLAAHWLAARDEAAALPWLLKAAAAARTGLRPREEAAFLRTAAGLQQACFAAGEHFEVLMRLQLAEAESAGPADALQRLAQAEAATEDELQRTRVLVRRASLLAEIGDYAQAVAVGEQALALALAGRHTDLLAESLATVASARAIGGQPQQAEDLMARHWALVEGLGPPSIKLHADRAVVLDRLGRPLQARPYHLKAIEIAQQQGRTTELITLLVNLAPSLIYCGEIGAADEALARAEQLHAAHEDMAQAAHHATLQRAGCLRDLGRYRQAITAFETGLQSANDQSALMVQWNFVQRASLWLALGQWTRLQQDLGAVVPDGLPGWARAALLFVRARVAQARSQPAIELYDAADQALPAGSETFLRLQIHLLRHAARAAGGVDAAALALAGIDPLLSTAREHGFGGLVLLTHWVAARAAVEAQQPAVARLHALACEAGLDGVTPRLASQAVWWHGLWGVWRALGEADRAEAARAEGVAWIHRTLQRELEPEFHAAFRDAVAAHRALLLG